MRPPSTWRSGVDAALVLTISLSEHGAADVSAFVDETIADHEKPLFMNTIAAYTDIKCALRNLVVHVEVVEGGKASAASSGAAR